MGLVPLADVQVTETGPSLLAPGTSGDYLITIANVGPSQTASTTLSMPTPDTSVVPVRNPPKPPPERLSLTLPVIQSADRIWTSRQQPARIIWFHYRKALMKPHSNSSACIPTKFALAMPMIAGV